MAVTAFHFRIKTPTPWLLESGTSSKLSNNIQTDWLSHQLKRLVCTEIKVHHYHHEHRDREKPVDLP